MIELNGMELTIEQVIAVARHNEQVRISEPAKEKINRARAYVDEKLAQKAVIYGLTTGFGKFSDTFVPEQETAALQRNLIISHACGMGAPLPREVVRGAMLLRCNALARGNSGIRLSTLETLLAMLNRGVHPVIPEKGSLGASGDLAPLAHIVLVMLGEGEAEYQNAVLPGKRAMELAGLAPVELAAKEGLALINGTQIMTAIACGVVYDAVQLAKTADIAAAMTCEAQLGILSAFDPEVHALRGQQGQMRTAVLSLRLAELDMLTERQHEAPLLLLDDVLSELDVGRRARLLERIRGVQTLLTCTDLSDLTGASPQAVLRVHNGEILSEI